MYRSQIYCILSINVKIETPQPSLGCTIYYGHHGTGLIVLMSGDTRHMIKTDLTRHFPRDIGEDGERLSGCLHLPLSSAPYHLCQIPSVSNPQPLMTGLLFYINLIHECPRDIRHQNPLCFCPNCPTPSPDSIEYTASCLLALVLTADSSSTIKQFVRGQRAACSGLFLHHTSHSHTKLHFPSINLQC